LTGGACRIGNDAIDSIPFFLLELPMIVLGDLSGIQNYLFDVAEAGGAQARRLRARSFSLQLLIECAALRVLRTLAWPSDDHHFLLSGAGKFVLAGPHHNGIEAQLETERQKLNDWLLRETRGELNLILTWAGEATNEVENYRRAQQSLQLVKARPWGSSPSAGWDPVRLVLAPLDTPCDLCRHAPAVKDETDLDTGTIRRVCKTCAENRNLGRRLPTARWLVIRSKPKDNDLNLFDLHVSISQEAQLAIGPETIVVTNYRDPADRPNWCPEEQFLKRRFMAHIPIKQGQGQPVEFSDLAQQSRGDHLLGVLKADADSLGVMIERSLIGQQDLRQLTDFSRELDGFFAGTLKDEIEKNWPLIYTIFAGGDDLVMVGPWDVMVKFAGRMRELFAQQFGNRELTISAGLALLKPKRPIKAAVAEAERLLEDAKTRTAPRESSPKDQIAAFGQLWKWHHHDAIMESVKQLVKWVDAGQMERGWLHTLLNLAEERHGDRPNLLATSRLAYHVDRNYKRRTDSRRWAESLVRRFDDLAHVEVRYLPSIVRYALIATRSPNSED
jgi:CRISPR-associated protein Csm1